MGTILDSYGDAADDHVGYAAQVLDDGTLTGTYSTDTAARMVGQVVAACGCGWTGTTRYPSPDLLDETAAELALGEWERDHARPTLDALRDLDWDRLYRVLRGLADSRLATTRVRYSELSTAQQRELLDSALTALDRATTLARQLRAPLTEGGEQL
jgi:hypothetical protein